ncbi:MAG: hypothetical protein RBQ97_05715, partial [Acholeplasma sp.]|nr:hypothetical protein [Acholeplasma sp.]
MDKRLKEIRTELVNYLYQMDLLELKEIEIVEDDVHGEYLKIIGKIDDVDSIIVNNLFNYSL